MAIQTIKESELAQAAVASLPSRPNAQPQFGGRGYTAKELKEAFDRLPRLIAQRLNELIEAVQSGEVLDQTYIPHLGSTLPVFADEMRQTVADLEAGVASAVKTEEVVDEVADEHHAPVTSHAVYQALRALLTDMESNLSGIQDAVQKLLGLQLYCDQNFVIHLTDTAGNLYGEGIDLPLESVVMDAHYDEEETAIVLTLQNGNAISIPLGDTLRGLVTTEAFERALAEKQDTLTIDDVPTYESPNLITSGGVYEHTQQYAAEETLWEVVEDIYHNIHHEYATKDELADVYDILGQTIIVEEELESEYTTRQTGDDIGILDGVMARMVRAYGSFETSEHDITPSTFEGIISTGNNILQLKANGYNNAWVEDGYWLHMRKDELPTDKLVAYMVDPTGDDNLIDFLRDGETYRVIQEPYFSEPTDSGYLFLQVKCSRKDGTVDYLSTDKTDQVFTVDKSQYARYEMLVYTKCESGFLGRDYKFTVCLENSGHKERVLPYKDYGFRLPEPITLGGFDYIDFDTQTIVRRTEYATLEEPFELGALEPYVADYECSWDGLRVAYYRLDGDWQEEYIDDLLTRYKAYEFGYEIPLPYGKCGYLKQAYYVKAGCIQ